MCPHCTNGDLVVHKLPDRVSYYCMTCGYEEEKQRDRAAEKGRHEAMERAGVTPLPKSKRHLPVSGFNRREERPTYIPPAKKRAMR